MKTRRTFLKEISIGTAGLGLFPFMLNASNANEPIAPIQKVYDLLIYGATPAGIACVVRAAREDLNVGVVSYYRHIGGILSNGLGVWDTLYEKKRSPVYDELRQSIFDDYKEKYGEDSPTYKEALPGATGHSNGTFEAKVVESLINKLVKDEKNIELIFEYYPVKAIIEDRIIQSLEFENKFTKEKIMLKATMYADCTYEGDLLPILKLPYRVGRESRIEFNEPHAGKIFMRNLNENKYNKNLDLRQFGTNQSIIYPESTGEGDHNVQAFNMRTTLTSDPNNRIDITIPKDYDADKVRNLEYGSQVKLPNKKICWNRPQLVGLHQKYVEGDWEIRNEVIEEHKKATLHKLYFLQNDSSVSKDTQDYWKQYGLPKDEYLDNDHMPYEIYVREGRRLTGEYIITQHDLMPAPAVGLKRTPVKYDSIAVTDWYMDSHACTTERTRDSMDEGKTMLHYDTYPGQIPFRSIYNKNVKNMLIPVCLSCTHVAWGAIRLEPAWMSIGESAAIAAVMAITEKKWLDELNIDKLQIRIAEKRIMIGFFNNFHIESDSSLIPAIQYFSTKGFFSGYDVNIDDILDENTAKTWIDICYAIINKKSNPKDLIVGILPSSVPISPVQFNEMLKQKGFRTMVNSLSTSLSIGQVIEILYQEVKQSLE